VQEYGTHRQITDDIIIRLTPIACRIAKDTDAHSEYVIFVAFPWQQWLRERTALLLLYSHCLFCFKLRMNTTNRELFIYRVWQSVQCHRNRSNMRYGHRTGDCRYCRSR